jgi:hypothetical protein
VTSPSGALYEEPPPIIQEASRGIQPDKGQAWQQGPYSCHGYTIQVPADRHGTALNTTVSGKPPVERRIRSYGVRVRPITLITTYFSIRAQRALNACPSPVHGLHQTTNSSSQKEAHPQAIPSVCLPSIIKLCHVECTSRRRSKAPTSRKTARSPVRLGIGAN